MTMLLLFSGVGLPGGGGAGILISGSSFTRKRFQEIVAAREARAALERKAQQATGERQDALTQAARAAEQAISSIEAQETETRKAELAKLTSMMEAASSASKVVRSIQLANAACAYAKRMTDADDEDEAMALLLLH